MALKLTIEALVYALLYGAFIAFLVLKQGAARQLYNYPPKIQERAVALGVTTKEEMAANAKKYKPMGFAIMSGLCLVIICAINHETTFWAGFYQSYIFLNAFSVFDAAVLDSMWFCHSKRWVIPGTEDMTEAYHDYWFHWKWVFIGLVSLIPVVAIIGGLTALIGIIF